MAVPEALAGLTAIPGVRTASQLRAPSPDAASGRGAGLDSGPGSGAGSGSGPGASLASGLGSNPGSDLASGSGRASRPGPVPGAGRVSGSLSGPGRLLAVLPELAQLLPGGGLRRGTTVAVRGATSLVLALLAAPTREGSWAAVTGLPELGLAAAAELGVDLERLALVPHPGAELVAVLSALVDGFDLVVLGPAVVAGVQPPPARQLASRVHHRGTVVLTVWPRPGADLELRVSGRRWHGLTPDGYGHLRFREVTATSRGRGPAARPRSVLLRLPGPGGAVTGGGPPERRLAEVAG